MWRLKTEAEFLAEGRTWRYAYIYGKGDEEDCVTREMLRIFANTYFDSCIYVRREGYNVYPWMLTPTKTFEEVYDEIN